MRRLTFVPFLLLSFMTGSVFAGSDFDRLKTLVGDWEATSPEGKSRITFKLISNGTALMETMDASSENMVTIYHPDGEGTLMTHYCAIGNQPRMRAQTLGKDSVTFQVVDVANLKGSDYGHMSRLVIRFEGADQLTEEWTWKEKGTEKTSVFHLRRVK